MKGDVLDVNRNWNWYFSSLFLSYNNLAIKIYSFHFWKSFALFISTNYCRKDPNFRWSPQRAADQPGYIGYINMGSRFVCHTLNHTSHTRSKYIYIYIIYLIFFNLGLTVWMVWLWHYIVFIPLIHFKGKICKLFSLKYEPTSFQRSDQDYKSLRRCRLCWLCCRFEYLLDSKNCK